MGEGRPYIYSPPFYYFKLGRVEMKVLKASEVYKAITATQSIQIGNCVPFQPSKFEIVQDGFVIMDKIGNVFMVGFDEPIRVHEKVRATS